MARCCECTIKPRVYIEESPYWQTCGSCNHGVLMEPCEDCGKGLIMCPVYGYPHDTKTLRNCAWFLQKKEMK